MKYRRGGGGGGGGGFGEHGFKCFEFKHTFLNSKVKSSCSFKYSSNGSSKAHISGADFFSKLREFVCCSKALTLSDEITQDFPFRFAPAECGGSLRSKPPHQR